MRTERGHIVAAFLQLDLLCFEVGKNCVHIGESNAIPNNWWVTLGVTPAIRRRIIVHKVWIFQFQFRWHILELTGRVYVNEGVVDVVVAVGFGWKGLVSVNFDNLAVTRPNTFSEIRFAQVDLENYYKSGGSDRRIEHAVVFVRENTKGTQFGFKISRVNQRHLRFEGRVLVGVWGEKESYDVSLFWLYSYFNVEIFLIFCDEKILNFTCWRPAKVREREGLQGCGTIFGHSCQLVRTSDNIVAIVLHCATFWRREGTQWISLQNGERFKGSSALGRN